MTGNHAAIDLKYFTRPHTEFAAFCATVQFLVILVHWVKRTGRGAGSNLRQRAYNSCYIIVAFESARYRSTVVGTSLRESASSPEKAKEVFRSHRFVHRVWEFFVASVIGVSIGTPESMRDLIIDLKFLRRGSGSRFGFFDC